VEAIGGAREAIDAHCAVCVHSSAGRHPMTPVCSMQTGPIWTAPRKSEALRVGAVL